MGIDNKRGYAMWSRVLLSTCLVAYASLCYAPPVGRPVVPHEVIRPHEAPRDHPVFRPQGTHEGSGSEIRVDERKPMDLSDARQLSAGAVDAVGRPEFDRFMKTWIGVLSDGGNANATMASELAKTRFFISPTENGKYLFIATDSNLFSSDPMSDGSGGNIGHFYIVTRPEGEWSLSKLFADTTLKSGSERTTLNEQLASSTIYDDRLLDKEWLPDELTARTEGTFSSKSPPPLMYRAKRFQSESSAKWYARTRGCCLYSGRPPDTASIRILQAQRFDRKEVHIVNLYDSSLVRGGLKKVARYGGKHSVTDPQFFSQNSAAKLAKIIKKAAGQTVLLVGHVDAKDAFVTEDAGGRELFRIPIKDVEVMAEQANVNLILMGCKTELAMNKPERGVGTVTLISARRVVDQLSKSILHSENWAEFLSSMAAPDLPLVAGPKLLQVDASTGNANGKLDFVRTSLESDGSSHPHKVVATLWIRFKCKVLRQCGG